MNVTLSPEPGINVATSLISGVQQVVLNEFDVVLRDPVDRVLTGRYSKSESARILVGLISIIVAAPFLVDPLASVDRKVLGTAVNLVTAYITLLSNSGLSSVPAERSVYDILEMLAVYYGPASIANTVIYRAFRLI